MKTAVFFMLSWALFISCQTKQIERNSESEREVQPKIDTLSTSSIGTSVEQKDEVKRFIPKGFRLAAEYTADLNQDAKEDKLLLLEVDDSVDSLARSRIFPDTFNLETTPLLILIRQENGVWKQVARNDEVIYYLDLKEDTGNGLSEIRFENGSFTVEYFFHTGNHHSTASYTFQYASQQKDWFLKAYKQSITSDSPTDSGGYDNTQEVTKSPKDFGSISFENFKLGDIK